VSFENLTPESLPGALFTAAFLSGRKDLNHRVRSSIISHVPIFDIRSLDEAAEALNIAFQATGLAVPPRRGLTAKALDTFSNKADQWIHEGIFLLTREEVNAPGARMHDLPPVLFALGNKSVVQLPAAAILNSRKPRRITPDDGWLADTKRLVRLALGEGFAIVSSYGNIPYSTVSRLSQGYPMMVACDDVLPFMASEKEALEFASAYHDLFNVERTLFVSPFPPGGRPGSSVRSVLRDHLVAAFASAVLVAEVRKGGNMQQIIDIASRRKVRIIGYPPYSSVTSAPTGPTQSEAVSLSSSFPENVEENILQPYRMPMRQRAVKSERVSFIDLHERPANSRWLIHYTRSCPGPWPGQTIAEYCQSLIEGHRGACHSAFDTLVHIIEERLIRASNRLTRGPCGVVPFSECLPQELNALIKWRKGLCRWSFEPYGIAFPSNLLAHVGARPAIYGSQEDFQHLPDDLKHLFQAQRSSSGDWTAEREWRVRGDLLLSDTIFQEMVAIVRTKDEARVVALEFGCKVALAGIGLPNRVRRS
jgi:hypothetical protein